MFSTPAEVCAAPLREQFFYGDFLPLLFSPRFFPRRFRLFFSRTFSAKISPPFPPTFFLQKFRPLFFRNIFFCGDFSRRQGKGRFCEGWLDSSVLPPEQKRPLTPYARKQSAKKQKKMLAPAYVPTHEYAVSSAMRSLTSGFGMEPGVPSSLWEPTNLVALGIALWRNFVRLPKGL